MNQDNEHLRLLSIFHYVVAGIGALISCFPLIHMVMGVVMLSGGFNEGGKAPPAAVGWVMIAIAAAIILTGWTISACIAYAGRCLARRQRYTFCFVMSCIACVVCSPFGTVLGIFTIIVLMRPTVKAQFGQPVAAG